MSVISCGCCINMNINENHKGFLTAAADFIADKVFDTNKKLLDKSYNTLDTIKGLADLVSTKEVNRDVVAKRLEQITEAAPNLEDFRLTDEDKQYIKSYIHTPWAKKKLGYNKPQTEREKTIVNILNNEGNRWMTEKDQDQAAIDTVEMMLSASQAFGGTTDGKPNLLTKKEEKKIGENIKEIPDGWQSDFLKAGFGSPEEAANARSRLRDAGINNYNDLEERKNEIDALITAYGTERFEGKDIKSIYDQLMLMPKEEFKNYVEEKAKKDKNERYAQAFKTGFEYVMAMKDQISNLRDLSRERAKAKYELEQATKGDLNQEGLMELKTMVSTDFDADEFKHPESDFITNADADKQRNQFLGQWQMINNKLGTPTREKLQEWWDTKGKELAKNKNGKSIFSLGGNKTKEDRDSANEVAKKFLHEYHKYLINNREDIPITKPSEKMVAWTTNEVEGIRDDIMGIRNKFTYGSSDLTRELDRFDTIRQGHIENALSESNSALKDILQNLSDDDIKNMSLQGIKELIDASTKIKDTVKLQNFAGVISAKDKKRREEYKELFDAGINQISSQMERDNKKEEAQKFRESNKEINPMFVSSMNPELNDMFNYIKKKNPEGAKDFAAYLVRNISNAYKKDTYIQMPEEQKQGYNNFITEKEIYNAEDLPEPGQEKEYEYNGRKIKIGRNVDRRNNITTYVEDPEVSPYRMIYNGEQPELPDEIDTNRLKMRGYQKTEPKIVPITPKYHDEKEPFRFNLNSDDGSLQIEPVYDGLPVKNPKQREKYNYLLFSYGTFLNPDTPETYTEWRTAQISKESRPTQHLSRDTYVSRESLSDLPEILTKNHRNKNLAEKYYQVKYGNKWEDHFKYTTLATSIPLSEQGWVVSRQNEQNEKFKQYLQTHKDDPNMATQNRISTISREPPINDQVDDIEEGNQDMT